MKKKLISVFAIFILCLSLFLTGALAADETTVTITNKDGESITLTAGKFYIVNDDVGGGVTVMDTIDNLTGYYFYLTYDGNGTLTLCSNGGNTCTIENVSMSVTGNLTIASAIDNLGGFNFHMSDTFQLNGATLTLDVPSFSLGKATNDTKPLIDNGTIVFADKQSQGKLTLSNGNGVIASGDLTIQNANTVDLSGFTAKGGVFSDNLTVNNCSNVTITQMNPANPVVINDDKITNDGHDNIVRNVTELDISQFQFTKTQEILDKLEPDTPIRYQAGDGWIDFQKTTGDKIKMTLDNATVAEDRKLLIGTVEFEPPDKVNLNLKDVIIEVKGDNKIATLEAQSIELTGGGSLTGALCTEGGTFTKDSFQGNLNALAISFPDSDSDSGIVTVYGKADWSLASFGFSVRQLIVSEGATLTIPSGYTVEIPLNVNADGAPIPVTIEGEIVNNGTVTLTGATTLDTPIDDKIKEIITQTLKLSGAGKVEVPVGSADGSTTLTYYGNSGDPLNVVNNLDLSNPADTSGGNLETDGYHWEIKKEDTTNTDKITSLTLTLNNFRLEKVNDTNGSGVLTLPDCDVTIKLKKNDKQRYIADNYIYKITVGDDNSTPNNAHLTFIGDDDIEGNETLTVQEQINIAGGDNNSLTVDTGATVIANDGIYIGNSGGLNSSVTVNGKLIANGGEYTALTAGKVEIGSTGTLNVSGKSGVNVRGMDNDNFSGVFTVADSGSFVADCSEFNIKVANQNETLPDNVDPANAIIIPEDYLPVGYEMMVIPVDNNKQIHLARKKDDGKYEIYNSVNNGLLTIHKHTDPGTFTPGADAHWKVCIECNSEIPNTRAAHSSSDNYTTANSDSTNHWKICSDCKEKFDSEPHIWNRDAATCTEDKTCTDCEKVGESALGHSYKYESDGDEHWQVCTRCNDQTSKIAHSFGNWIITKPATTTETGSQYRQCSDSDCGYKETQTIPKLDPTHTHNWANDWSHNETHHWHECAADGCDITDNSQKGGYATHTPDRDNPTETEPIKCSVCGYIITPELNHTHNWAEEWTKNEIYHWYSCSGCNEVDKKEKHTYDDDSDKTCNVCGYERTVNTPENPDSTYHVTADTTSEYGTFTASPNPAKAGEKVTLTATPNSGYHFKEWNVKSGNVTLSNEQKITNPLTFIMPAGDVKIEAVFEKDSVPSRPSGGGGGGGSSSSSSSITIEQPEHGKITSNRPSASRGTSVTLTVTPDDGYQMKSLTVTDSQNNAIKLTDQGDGKYTFTMPSAAIKVKAVFEPLPEPSKPDENNGDAAPALSYSDYTDLDSNAWYSGAVDYVLKAGLMQGYGDKTFAPNDTLSRAMLAQILYNREGKPATTGNSGFTDVTDGQWYAPAVAWAASKGIISGYNDGRFGSNDNITREQVTVMLWRYAGSPAAKNQELSFSDTDETSEWATDALRWAVENDILHGYNDGRLDPKGFITRAETAQMLQNYLK